MNIKKMMNISRRRKDHGVQYGPDKGNFHKHTAICFLRFHGTAEEDSRRTKGLFEGVWLAWYPGQPYDVSDADYLIIWRVDDNYICIDASTRWTSGVGVVFPIDDPSDGRMLDEGDGVYELDENDTDILYKRFKESHTVVSERPDVLSYRRFTSVDLDQLEAFWAERR